MIRTSDEALATTVAIAGDDLAVTGGIRIGYPVAVATRTGKEHITSRRTVAKCDWSRNGSRDLPDRQ